MNLPLVTSFFDEATNNVSHIAVDPETNICAIIDSLLDYDPAAGRTSTSCADQVVDFVQQNELQVGWIIDTHVHADHLTASYYLKQKLGGRIGIGEHITSVQKTFKELFNEGCQFPIDGSQFDHLFKDGETYQVGNLPATAIHTPGHTPVCMVHLIGDAAFVGDTLFMPDYGTARCDFPDGDAHRLYRSIQKIFLLPEDTRMFLCHDYKAPGRNQYQWETTVREQKRSNIHVHDGITEDAFVKMRTTRDASLALPKLLVPSVQVNMRAGAIPAAEANGISYIKVPINTL